MNKNNILKMLANIAAINKPVFRSRHAACITYKNRIVSFGLNREKTHPLQSKFSKHANSIYLHAEIDAIVNAIDKIDLSLCKLYVVRVKWKDFKEKQLMYGNSTPCLGCFKAIKFFNIKELIYSQDEDYNETYKNKTE